MITVQQAKRLHSALVEKTGGADGLRDLSSLEAALNRPFATFDGNDLYPTVEEKAAAIIESILINHPFIDGNKRTGFALMRIILRRQAKMINATEDIKYNFVIQIAEGKLNTAQITDWIQSHVTT